jgi:hypothetical protein
MTMTPSGSLALSESDAPVADRVGLGQRFRRRFGLSPSAAVTLAAVGLVVVLVSLPRLRAFALEANEVDAARLTRLFADALAADPLPPGVPAFATLLERPDLARQAADVEAVADPSQVRCHGYLFQITPGEPARVEAWPWECGRTGRAAFRQEVGGRLERHANDGGLFSGPRNGPANRLASEVDGWTARGAAAAQ